MVFKYIYQIKILLLIVISIILFNSSIYSKDTYYFEAFYTQGKYYKSNVSKIPEDNIINYELYVEVTYNSKGKLLEENFYIKSLLVCKRIYSPRFDRALREELYKWDLNGNKTIYEKKNFYTEKSTFKEKSITSAVYDPINGKKRGLFVNYELFSEINNIECKRIKQYYENGKLKYSWIYYYDIDGTLIVIEERNPNNVIIRIGRTDFNRLMIGTGEVEEAVVWRDVDE